MKLLRLYAENFLSFEKLDVQLDSQGLVGISGDNRDDPDFDSNGSGKTSILDAISWVFFGVTSKEERHDDVVNRHVGKNCVGIVGFMDDEGQKYRAIRYRKHDEHENNLYLLVQGEDGEMTDLSTKKSVAETEKLIESLLGMNFLTYCNSVAFLQHKMKRFSAATDGEKKKIMEQILEIQVLSKCLKETNSQITNREAELRLKENSVESLTREYEREQEVLADLQTKKEEIETKRQEKLKEFEEKIESCKDTCADMANTASAIYDKIIPTDALEEKLKEHESTIVALKERISREQAKLQTNVVPKEVAYHQKVKEAEKIKRFLKNKKDQIGAKCPECTQIIPTEVIAEITKEKLEAGSVLKQEIEALEKEIIDQKSAIESAISTAEGFVTNEAEQADAIRNSISECQVLIERYNGVKAKLDTQNQFLKELEEQRDDLALTQPTFDDSIAASETRLQRISKELNEEKKAIKETNIEIDHLKFWVKGFSQEGMKSYVLDSVVPFLNDRANYYSQLLTSGSIRIKFSTHSYNKSGNLKENLDVKVTNRFGGGTYKSCSTGEKRRIDLAIMMALHELVASRSSKKFNICIFDEMFEHLDESGINTAMTLLNEISKVKDSIFVITHREELKLRFPRKIHIVKEGGISHVTTGQP